MRTCGECTLCCRGTLTVKVQEHKVFPGVSCPHVTDCGCGIYGDSSRPDICDSYQCMWLTYDYIPEWMRPDKVGFILTLRDQGVILTGDFIDKNISGSGIIHAIKLSKILDKPLFYTIPSIAGQNLYDRGSIVDHPDTHSKLGTLDEIFEPIELFNDE